MENVIERLSIPIAKHQSNDNLTVNQTVNFRV